MRDLRLFLFLFTQIFNISIYAQAKNDYNWVLGYPPNDPDRYFGGTMLKFSPDLAPPEYFETRCVSGDVSILSDSNGKLLLYSEGCRIYNSHHSVMDNGDSIAYGKIWRNYCDFVGYPGTQNHLILPWPGDTSQAIALYIKESDDHGHYLRNLGIKILYFQETFLIALKLYIFVAIFANGMAG
ncbi:MAG: hypothetical protein IPP15_14180 [Saprospiraceae bacterium]|uniref:Uncharacterized protein n=1 Tax=Candidatus Opimibacter skivensis TaxID=2982028 RepID=A0A9D7SWL4_9BACT|nr:hypothetical protein [Candidatus Opimibacter skivensis]